MAYFLRGDRDAETMFHIIAEIEGAHDRSAAIVGGALIEQCLEEALIAYLHHDKNITKELFRPSGAIGAFETKIRLGKLVGLYSDAAYRDLMILKKIRNRFAHEMDASRFEQPPFRDWANNLTFVDRYVGEPPTGDPKSWPRNKPTKDAKMRDYHAWIIRRDRATLIGTPRGRFVLSVQLFTWAFSANIRTAMPEPEY